MSDGEFSIANEPPGIREEDAMGVTAGVLPTNTARIVDSFVTPSAGGEPSRKRSKNHESNELDHAIAVFLHSKAAASSSSSHPDDAAPNCDQGVHCFVEGSSSLFCKSCGRQIPKLPQQ